MIKTAQVTVLLACQDEKGILRFPIDHGFYFGLSKRIDAARPIAKQLAEFVSSCIGKPGLPIDALCSLEPILQAEGAEPSLLYLMRVDPGNFRADPSWPTLIGALKEMPQGKSRVAYNKALQYFAGAADAKVDVLEVDKEVADRLRDLMKHPPHNLL